MSTRVGAEGRPALFCLTGHPPCCMRARTASGLPLALASSRATSSSSAAVSSSAWNQSGFSELDAATPLLPLPRRRRHRPCWSGLQAACRCSQGAALSLPAAAAGATGAQARPLVEGALLAKQRGAIAPFAGFFQATTTPRINGERLRHACKCHPASSGAQRRRPWHGCVPPRSSKYYTV